MVPDVNLLLCAHVSAFAEHPKALAWWEGALNGTEPVLLAPPAIFGFLRIATHRRIFDPPLALEAALGHVESWLARPNVQVLGPGPRHLPIAFGLLREARVARDLTTDLQLGLRDRAPGHGVLPRSRFRPFPRGAVDRPARVAHPPSATCGTGALR